MTTDTMEIDEAVSVANELPSQVVLAAGTMPWRTPGVDLAELLGGDTGVVQLVETISEEVTTILVVVLDSSRGAVAPIRAAELCVARRFPRARFDVRITQAKEPWELAALPPGSRQHYPQT